MSPHPYTEDQLVEQPAIALFADLGWQTLSAMEEVFGPSGTLGRETSGDVVLVPRLRAMLERLNPQLPAEAILSAVDELTRDRSAMTLAGANREVCGLLKDGVKVAVPDRERGGPKDERVRVVDWENPASNDFLLISQMTVTRQLYTCRPDLVGFLNGGPWLVIELKKPGVSARQAFDDNLTSYKHTQNGIPQKILRKLPGNWTFVVVTDRVELDEKPTSSDLERLKAAVRTQLERMVRLNPTRADYLEKFKELIDAYNSGSRNIEVIFRDLLALTGVLTEEQERHVREHLSEEELTIFDILTRPGPTLSTKERDEVKKVARQLLERLDALLVLGWRQKAQARAGVRLAIEDGLDEGLPRAYTKETYQSKCNVLFEHVYESYMGDGKSSYTELAYRA